MELCISLINASLSWFVGKTEMWKKEKAVQFSGKVFTPFKFLNCYVSLLLKINSYQIFKAGSEWKQGHLVLPSFLSYKNHLTYNRPL